MAWCYYSSKTAQALQDMAAAGNAVAVIPIGAVEQHGPHLPVGTDYISAEDLTRLAMEKVESEAQFFVMPTIQYALSIEHIFVPGTITLSYDTVIRILVEIGESLLRLGVKKMVLVNGHGGNDSAIQIAGRILRGKGMYLYMVNGGSIRGKCGAQDYHVHADRFETGAMLALHPEMVDKAKITQELATSIDKWNQAPDSIGDLISYWYIDDVAVNGVVGDPQLATEENGREFLEQQSALTAKAIALVAELVVE